MKKTVICLLLCGLLAASTLSAAAGLKVQASSNKNPTRVAQQLYQAWRLKSRAAAFKIADKDVVDKLFGVRWRAMKFEGCHHRDEGGFECVYRDAKNDFSMAMIVDGGVSVGGYNVASLSFSSEE